MKKPTVFISYSHADSQLVDELANKLKASDVDVWIDKWIIKVGDSIIQKINEGIKASDFLIVVLSRASVNSKWVREELSAATIRNIEQERHGFILPVLLEDCEIPALLRHRKYADFKSAPERAFQELLEVIRPVEALTRRVPRPVFRPEQVEPRMILIPAGEFIMGNDHGGNNEKPKHTLYLPNYYLAETPVTNSQYYAFVLTTGHRPPEHWWVGEKIPKDKKDHPVVCISWYDAVSYCRWLSEVTGKLYRLPSEAEWEKAARGTDERFYPWGNPWKKRRCNIIETGRVDTTSVDAYPKGASPYGVLDMAGNVWEWTCSFFKPYPYNPDDGREDLEADGPRVLRGGAFWGNRRMARCTYRFNGTPDARTNDRGFRVVLSFVSP